jgi:DEAD/DEAH box helicase domain-containing protein
MPAGPDVVERGRYARNVVARRTVPAAPPRLAPLPPGLDPRLAAALEERGTGRLYEHQAEALAALDRGEHVLIVTPTASGKSLVYQAPAIQAALGPGPARSLFLFPYKALAQDQIAAFDALSREVRPIDPVRAAIYDGDTPAAERRRIKAEPPDVLLTNPDMLHLALLAHHESWRDLFRTLRYVVVDELHVYRGVLGSHLHHVLRRLRRLCRHHGSDPRFIVSSATVANPGPFGELLLGLPLTVVDRSGAPRAARHFVLVNPPASPYTAAAHLLADCMDAGLKTIAFTKARRITELMQRWIAQERPDLRPRLAAYRAGYLSEERREIERRLFSGDLLGVVSTSALELGVDVGGLDVCILVGYPGSIVRFWQRVGRVGRRERDSLVILIGMPDALDQYFLRHPQELFERGYEQAVADPGNPTIARAHLICAGAELPLSATEPEPELLPGALERARQMAASGDLVLDAEGRRYYSLRRRPQRDVDLRSGGRSFAIIDAASRRAVGQIDGVRVYHECHPGAIYLHAGRQFRVEDLDLDRRRVHAVRSDDDWYTEVISEKETEILWADRQADRGPFRAGLGQLRVTEEIKGYQRRRLFGQEVLSTHPLDLPPLVFETVGLWLDLPDSLRDEVVRREGHFMGAIHAVEHAAISLFPLLAIADRGDIGGISYPLHPQTGRAAVFIYDGHPGGVGLSARGFEELGRLLERTREQIAACGCDDGCPSCVHSPKCGNGNKPLDKASALWLLEVLTGREALEGAAAPPPLAIAASPCGAPADPPRPPEPGGSAARGPERGSDDRWPPAAGASPAPRWLERALPTDEGWSPAGGSAPPAGPERRSHDRWPPPAGASPAPRRPERALPTHDGWSPAAGGSALPAGPERAPRPHDWPAPSGPRGPMDGRPAGGPAPGARPIALAAPAPASLPAAGCRKLLAFDLETRRSAEEVGGWDHLDRMGLALAAVEDLDTGDVRTYREEQARDLIIDLLSADLVVGFNLLRFDYPVLEAYAAPGAFRRVPTLDILQRVHAILGFRVKLDGLARASLGRAKSADGLQSLQWVREGRWDLIEQYCRSDVRVTADLYRFGREHGYLLYPDHEGRAMRAPVRW